MKKLNRNYLAQLEKKVLALETEFQKPGSAVFLGTAIGGFSVYGIAAMALVAYDVFLKVFYF